MRVNLEIRDAAFPLHLFILRGEDIYCSQVYPLFCTSLNSNHGYPFTSFLLNSTFMEANRG